MASSNSSLQFRYQSVKVVRGREASTIKKMQSDGWELDSQDQGLMRTEMTFRQVVKPRPWPLIAVLSITVLLTIAGVVSVVMAGGKDGAPDTTASQTRKPEATASQTRKPEVDPVVKNATYQSVDALMAAAIKAGYPCPERKVLPGFGLNARPSGSCSDQDTFSLAYLTRRGGVAMQQAADDIETELADDPVLDGATYLVGPNWGIACSAAWAVKLQRILGGAIATVP